MADDEAKKAKQAEIDRKRAEVRRRMEEASKAKKAKKGFMTPERKKKLRLLLRKKAAEELKKEQERKAAERRRIIEERCGRAKNLDDANEEGNEAIVEYLKKVVTEYYGRMYICEGQKWDLEHEVRKRDYEIADLNSQVNDLRGKFVKPTLKKVSKYENKFAKLQKKAAEFNFRNQLKVVKKKEFTLEEEDKEKKSIVDFKKDEKKEGEEGGEGTAEGVEGETPPVVDELSGNPLEGGEAPPAEGAEPGAEGAVVDGEGAAPVEGEGGAPPDGEQPPEPEPEPEEVGPYMEPEDTPSLIEDMQNALKLLRRTSKSLSLEDLTKLLNTTEEGGETPTGGEENLQNPPVEGELPSNPEGEMIAGEVNAENPPPAAEGEVAPTPDAEPAPAPEVQATEAETTPVPEAEPQPAPQETQEAS